MCNLSHLAQELKTLMLLLTLAMGYGDRKIRSCLHCVVCGADGRDQAQLETEQEEGNRRHWIRVIFPESWPRWK